MARGYSKDAAAVAALTKLLPGWDEEQVKSELAFIQEEDGVETPEAIESLLAEWFFDHDDNARLITVHPHN